TQVVVICGGFLACLRVFSSLGLLQLDRLVVGLDRLAHTFLLFIAVGLLDGRAAIGVAQLEPEQVAGGVHLGRFGQSRDRSIVVTGAGRLVGNGEFFVQRLYGVRFFGCLLLRLLHLFGLFRRHSLSLGLVRQLFLHVEVEHVLVERHREVGEVINLFI